MTALPITLKEAKRLLRQSQVPLRSPIRSFYQDKSVIFYYTTTCRLGNLNLTACVYLSERRHVEEMERFMEKIESIEKALKRQDFTTPQEAMDWLYQR